MRHLENAAKVMLATGSDRGLRLLMETFIALYSGNNVRALHDAEPAGSVRTAVFYWLLILCNILIPQVLWFRKVRKNTGWRCS